MKTIEEKIINHVSTFLSGDGNKLKGRNINSRESSFDYCFNYFQKYKPTKQNEDNPKNLLDDIEKSCLHIGFYLASWGMLRGSSFLLQHSYKFYEPLITAIADFPCEYWYIDVPNYMQNNNIKKLIECGDKIRIALSGNGVYSPTDIQITKVMLGVFANVPAFDTNFPIGFKELSGMKVSGFNYNSLDSIYKYYTKYQEIIQKLDPVYTLEYSSGQMIMNKYTFSKLIDMMCFVEGFYIEEKKKSAK